MLSPAEHQIVEFQYAAIFAQIRFQDDPWKGSGNKHCNANCLPLMISDESQQKLDEIEALTGHCGRYPESLTLHGDHSEIVD